eukprot:329304_1
MAVILFVLLTVRWTIGTSTNLTLTHGLIAHFKFNDPVNFVADISGNGNDLTNYGATQTLDRFGVCCTMHFDGSSRMIVNTPNNFPAMYNSERTLVAWFKTTNSNDKIIVSIGSNHVTTPYNEQFAIAVTTNGVILYGGGSVNDLIFSDSLNYADNTWKYLVVTKQGNNAQLYIDSVYVGSTTDHTYYTGASETQNIMIGDWNDLNRLFDGDIDDVRVYDRALTQLEIDALYLEAPTESPTTYPTDQPTIIPTSYPTSYPTFQPTIIPTSYPTSYPTYQPTIATTLFPSLNPTVFPSSQPSIVPTLTTDNPTESTSFHTSTNPTESQILTTVNDKGFQTENDTSSDTSIIVIIIVACLVVVIIIIISFVYIKKKKETHEGNIFGANIEMQEKENQIEGVIAQNDELILKQGNGNDDQDFIIDTSGNFTDDRVHVNDEDIIKSVNETAMGHDVDINSEGDIIHAINETHQQNMDDSYIVQAVNQTTGY